MSFGNLNDLVKKYAPVIYLHEDETYNPASAEWYMSKVNYLRHVDNHSFGPGQWTFEKDKTGKTTVGGPGSSPDYMVIPGDDGIDPDPPQPVMEIRAGSIPDATAYVHVQPVLGTTTQVDLQYWLFYPFNGAEYIVLGNALWNSSTDLDLSFHQGDWEYVTVRVDDQGNIVGVHLSQHSGGLWLTQPTGGDAGGYSVEEDTHVVSYVARGSHANYPAAGGPWVIGGFDLKVLSVQVADYTTKGKRVDYSRTGGCVVIRNDAQAAIPDAVKAPAWLAFRGRWGSPSQVQLNPSSVAQTMWAAVKATLPLDLAEPFLAAAAALGGTIGLLIYKEDQEGPYNPPAQGPWSAWTGPGVAATPQPLVSGNSVLTYSGSPAILSAGANSPTQFYWQPAGAAVAAILEISPGVSSPANTNANSSSGVACVRTTGASSPSWFLLTNPAGAGGPLQLWQSSGGVTFFAAATLPGIVSGLGTLVASGNALLCAYPAGTSLAITQSTVSSPGTWAQPVTQNSNVVLAQTGGVVVPPAGAALADGSVAIVYATPLASAGGAVGLACIVSKDLQTWKGPYAFPLTPDSADPSSVVLLGPAVAASENTLFCAWVDGAQRLRFSQSHDGTTWSYPVSLSDAAVTGAPAVAANSKLITVAALTTQSLVTTYLYNYPIPERVWSPWAKMEIPGPSSGGPQRFQPGSPITAVFSDPNTAAQLNLFAVDGNPSTAYAYSISRTNDKWDRQWTRLDSNNIYTSPDTPVTAVFSDASHLDIFMCGTDGTVCTLARVNGEWAAGGWSPVGSKRAQPGERTTALYRDPPNPTQLDLYFTDGADQATVFSYTRANGNWSDVTNVAPSVYSNAGATVTAVATSPICMELFMAGQDGSVFTIASNNGIWGSNWQQVLANVAQAAGGAPITAVYLDAAKTILKLFMADGGGHVFALTRRNGEWDGVCEPVAQGEYTWAGGSVNVLCRDEQHLELFMAGTDGTIWTIAWDADAGWAANWTIVSGASQTTTSGYVTAIGSRGAEELFITDGSDGTVYHSSSKRSGAAARSAGAAS